MQNKPLLSIVTSIYNGGEAFGQFLQSISNQTYENIEVILVDDCSTDKTTLGIINDLESGKLEFKKPFKLIRNSKNLGLMESFQKGLDNAIGEYFAFPESDDILDLNFYEVLMKEALTFGGIDVVKGLLLNRYNKKRAFIFNEKDAIEIPEACIFANETLPLIMRNSNGQIISYIMPDVTYCWFYVFSKNILKDNSNKPLFKNAVLYGFNPSPFSVKYIESKISLDKASFYYYDAHPEFEAGGYQIHVSKDNDVKNEQIKKFKCEKSLLESIFKKYDKAIEILEGI